MNAHSGQIIVLGRGMENPDVMIIGEALGPDEVKEAATIVTASVEEDGVAAVLSGLEGIIYGQN